MSQSVWLGWELQQNKATQLQFLFDPSLQAKLHDYCIRHVCSIPICMDQKYLRVAPILGHVTLVDCNHICCLGFRPWSRWREDASLVESREARVWWDCCGINRRFRAPKRRETRNLEVCHHHLRNCIPSCFVHFHHVLLHFPTRYDEGTSLQVLRTQ